MADKDVEQKKVLESSEDKKQAALKTATEIKAKPKPKKIKYYNVDDFIASVKGSGLYDINNMQMANFKALMISKDKYMVEDEQEFVNEFNKFIEA